jgi:hypothetical protein
MGQSLPVLVGRIKLMRAHIKLQRTIQALLLFCFALLSTTLQAEEADFQQKLDQGLLYLKKNMYQQAKEELLPLYQMEQGKRNSQLLISLAKISYELYLMTDAFKFLGEARNQSDLTSSENRDIKEMYDEWKKQYAPVTFQSAGSPNEGIFTLKSTSTLINQHKKSVVQESAQQMALGAMLPLSIYLPYGSYLANQTPFTLTLNEPSPVVEVVLTPLPKTKKQNSNILLYTGIGVGIAVVTGLGLYFLSQDTSEPKFTVNTPEF